MKFETPILFIGFNRPDTSREVLKVLEKVKPINLYVAIDGPRKDVKGEKEQCAEVSRLFDNVNWDCKVHKLIREENLGCAVGVSSAITWFFDNVEQGIIIEDDCVPSLSFFPFSEELLNKYKDSKDIFHISGNNFQNGKMRGDGDYYFSVIPHAWGWATWRRAWKYFELDFSGVITKDIKNFVKNERLLKRYEVCFKNTLNGRYDTWDYPWVYWCWNYQGKSILPNRNLVTNIGFGEGATHTTNPDSVQSNVKAYEILFPLNHPSNIEIDRKADKYTFYKIFNQRPNYWIRVKHQVKLILKKLFIFLKIDGVFLPIWRRYKMND